MKPILLETKYSTLAGLEWGDPFGKPILAFHGWLDNANSFEALATHFPDYRFISMDFSGHGKSSHKPPGSLYHFAEYCLDIVSSAQALGLSDFILFSHSMGAAISTLVAGAGILPIQKLVLIESLGPISNATESGPELLRDAIKQALHPKGRKETFFPDLETAISIRIKAGDMHSESAEKLMERGLEKTPRGLKPRRDLRLHQNSFLRMTEEQVLAFCREIKIPTLLILGEDSIYPIAEKFKARKEAIPHLEAVMLPGGHHLHMDTPEPVAKVIRDFLEKP